MASWRSLRCADSVADCDSAAVAVALVYFSGYFAPNRLGWVFDWVFRPRHSIQATYVLQDSPRFLHSASLRYCWEM